MRLNSELESMVASINESFNDGSIQSMSINGGVGRLEELKLGGFIDSYIELDGDAAILVRDSVTSKCRTYFEELHRQKVEHRKAKVREICWSIALLILSVLLNQTIDWQKVVQNLISKN